MAELAGEQRARAIQLSMEYDPKPPFDSGHPKSADPKLVAGLTAFAAKSQAAASRVAVNPAAASLEAESQAAALSPAVSRPGALSPAVSRPAASSRAANPAARHLAAEKALRRKGKNLSSVERRAPDFGARTFALAETPRWLRQASVSQSMSFTNRRARPVRAF